MGDPAEFEDKKVTRHLGDREFDSQSFTFTQKGSMQMEAVRAGLAKGVTATGVLSRERGNLITISITLY